MRVDSLSNHFTVGASALGSKALVIDDVWQQPSAANTVARVASDACVQPMKHIDKVLLTSFGDTATRRRAIKYFPGTMVSGAVWHHGDHYLVSIKGEPARILEHCSLPQTEREHIVLEAARRRTRDREVIALASGNTPTAPDSLDQVRTLQFVGFVIVKPVLA